MAIPGGAAGVVRLRDADGLIALAEPREDGTLKPIVGFRG
jgi:tRNA pseudouridine55 synthase